MDTQQKISEQAPKVPKGLINELHEANQRLHEKRKQMEETHDDYDAELEDREASLDQLRKVDHEFNEVKEKIDQSIRSTEPSDKNDQAGRG
jgi:DNA repair exonuclease SbcCD ATPase subunit